MRTREDDEQDVLQNDFITRQEYHRRFAALRSLLCRNVRASRMSQPDPSVDIDEDGPTQPLSNVDIERELGTLRGWKREEGGIRKRFRHASFVDAIAFVNSVAGLAELAKHHPDIDIRWRNVIIFLTTHEAGGVTVLDLTLAREIEKVSVDN